MSAAFQRVDEPCADRAMRRMREIREACVAALEVHHEAIGEVQAVAFRGDVGSALEVRERDPGNLREPPDLLEEGEATRSRHFASESA
ncbi:hypothetical protein PQR16_13735 [Caballeronia glebae]|nr:hypothetical protein [Caballeronia glebae]